MRCLGGSFLRLALAIGLFCYSSALLAEPLRVAAASSLRLVLPAIIEAYQQRFPEEHVLVTYGASGRLVNQIRNDAPFHLFLSADRHFAEVIATEQNLSLPTEFARGSLVAWTTSSVFNAMTATQAIHLVIQDKNQKLVIPNPAHAPFGAAALEWLKTHTEWPTIEPQLVFAESASQVLHFVRSGAGIIGITAGSIRSDELGGVWLQIDASHSQSLSHHALVLNHSERSISSIRFQEFLYREQLLPIYERFGLSVR